MAKPTIADRLRAKRRILPAVLLLFVRRPSIVSSSRIFAACFRGRFLFSEIDFAFW